MSDPELDYDRPLPAAVKRDLDRAAAGIGRVPTTAHPLCICTQTYLIACTWCGATRDKPCGPRKLSRPIGDPLVMDPPCPVNRYRQWTKWDCPQHRPEPKK